MKDLIKQCPELEYLTGDDMQGYIKDWRKRYQGQAKAVLFPKTTKEVQTIVRYANEHHLHLIPQGGNTGLCGGAVPQDKDTDLVINLSKMNQVCSIDTQSNIMIVQAGVTLQEVQEQARKVNRLFPLSLPSEGSCTIGGNVATNAGGTQVLRYGNTRSLCAGLEVVMPNGDVLSDLKSLKKDNTGYDIKQLLIGSEGTLGIITKVAVKLFPATPYQNVGLFACQSLKDISQLFEVAREKLGIQMSGFEIWADVCFRLVKDFCDIKVDPFKEDYPWYALIEYSQSSGSQEQANQIMQDLAEQTLEKGISQNVAIANTSTQCQKLWSIRKHIPVAESLHGKAIKHDICLPVSKIPDFIEYNHAHFADCFPNALMITFGHFGDGNLHYNIGTKDGQESIMPHEKEINRLVYEDVWRFDGSISAEHGIGLLKTRELEQQKDTQWMNMVKNALDPNHIMNPGKVLAEKSS